MSQPPLRLAGMGSFHAGGRGVTIEGEPPRTARFTATASVTYDPNGQFAIEQCYVQWFHPESPRAPRPLLFVHGGGLTGACWETTPDGRPGWVELFLRAGFPVYVMDAVERGRAGWCVLPGIWDGEPIGRSAEWAWELFRFGRRADYPDRPFQGQRFPTEAMDAFCKSFVPRWLTTTDAQVAALSAAIARIGPCDIICHSQGGELALRAAVADPDRVHRIVALEPSGIADGLDPARQRLLTVLGDYWDATPADTERAARMRAFAAGFAKSGGHSDLWDLPAMGRPGHSHMLMMDHGHDTLAADIAAWLLAD